MRELEEAHTPHGGQIAVRKNGDRDGRLGRAGAAGSEQLCFDPHAGGPAAHDDGVAARRPVSLYLSTGSDRVGDTPPPPRDLPAPISRTSFKDHTPIQPSIAETPCRLLLRRNTR